MREVVITGVGLLCPAGVGAEGARGGRPGEVPGFRARAYIRDRKSIKLMSRAVQLGVSAVCLALSDAGGAEDVPPHRRGMFVGASPNPGDPDDLRPAIEVALDAGGHFDIGRFASQGIGLIHPLWLVRGLSNNVLGFGSATFDLQGVNANWCDGEEGGWTALVEGARAVAEERADLVVAGGSDSLVGAEPLFPGRKCGEGAAFVVLRPAGRGGVPFPFDRSALDPEEHDLGYLGAATWPVALGRALLRARAN